MFMVSYPPVIPLKYKANPIAWVTIMSRMYAACFLASLVSAMCHSLTAQKIQMVAKHPVITVKKIHMGPCPFKRWGKTPSVVKLRLS